MPCPVIVTNRGGDRSLCTAMLPSHQSAVRSVNERGLLISILISWLIRTAGLRDISNVDEELVAVSGAYGDRQPHGLSVTVEGGPENFVHGNPAIRRQLEELRFDGVRRTDGNPVAITDLLDVEGLGQVLDGSFLDVAGAPELLRSALGELHRVKRRLH